MLSKLFQKSGVHSALRHDVIVGDGGGDTVADYELVETEAERVAKEAVDSLRASRRQCFRAEAGVPTWTGQGGVRFNACKRPMWSIRIESGETAYLVRRDICCAQVPRSEMNHINVLKN